MIKEKIIYELKTTLVYLVLVFGTTIVALKILEVGGVDKETLKLGFSIGIIVYSVWYSWRRTANNIVDWMEATS